MQIQVNTDSHIEGGAKLTRRVEVVIENAVGRFSDRITRVAVHLTDESSSAKDGDDDKRCVIEARLAGLQPIAVSHQGPALEQALSGAADKLEKSLRRMLGRLDDPRARSSSSGEPPI
ncbi:MAG: HPF/RaiA family ribosome-associated protein [Gammaproteobacteria bacterium]